MPDNLQKISQQIPADCNFNKDSCKFYYFQYNLLGSSSKNF